MGDIQGVQGKEGYGGGVQGKGKGRGEGGGSTHSRLMRKLGKKVKTRSRSDECKSIPRVTKDSEFTSETLRI